MEMPKLTDHHKKLYALIGDWEGTETIADTHWAPGGTAIGKLHVRSDMDGFFVLQDYIQEKARKVTFSGHGIFGYDAVAGDYTWYWVDSTGFVPAGPARGKFEGDTLLLQTVSPNSASRYTHRLEPGGKVYHLQIENSFDQQKSWQTFLSAVYERR